MGYRVAVLEKRSSVGKKYCCTGIISRECAEAFAIPGEVIFRQCNSARLISPQGDYIQVYKPETQACIIRRSEFDRLLANRAADAGARYHLSTDVKQVVFQPDRVLIEAVTESQSVSFEARTLVAACGFNPVLIKHLGLGKIGYFVHGAQTEVVSAEVREVEVYFSQKTAPGFFSWIVPTDQGHCLVGLLSHRSPATLLQKWLAELEAMKKIKLNGSPVRYGSIPLRPLNRTCGDRLLAAGDAAGQVKPTTGGGIYFGLLCADMAADALHKAFSEGNFSAGRLSEYDQAWSKKLRHELRTEYLARQIYEHLTDKQIEILFKNLKQSGLIESVLQQADFSFDWHGGLMLKAVKFGAQSGVKRLLALPSRLFRG
jgi:digeranylgeranylglycerophospholipid reductase